MNLVKFTSKCGWAYFKDTLLVCVLSTPSNFIFVQFPCVYAYFWTSPLSFSSWIMNHRHPSPIQSHNLNAAIAITTLASILTTKPYDRDAQNLNSISCLWNM